MKSRIIAAVLAMTMLPACTYGTTGNSIMITFPQKTPINEFISVKSVGYSMAKTPEEVNVYIDGLSKLDSSFTADLLYKEHSKNNLKSF
jgi:hypothetical protein